jgi:hypothetical protein
MGSINNRHHAEKKQEKQSMRSIVILLFTVLTGMALIQCDRDTRMENHQMGDQQMQQMMQNPEMRRGMMQRMTSNPEMRREIMNQMRSGMGQMNREEMLDRMQAMMEDPERKEQMLAHLQNMQAMLENETFDREQMRQMMDKSPMMGMHMQCMQMMQEPGSDQSQD